MTARSSRGSSDRGSSRATRTSSPRRAACWISTRGALRASGCTRASTSSALMRSPSCRHWRAATRRPQPYPAPPRHQTVAAGPGRPALVEFEYRRGGTLAYLAAWDVHHARIFGRCEPKTGIEPYGRLVRQVMSTEPYASAKTVFWIVDNGSSHAGQRSIDRLENNYANARLIHLPIHASWLNQIEIYFSILQRKALTPNDFADLDALAARITAFEDHYQRIAKPLEWTFTRAKRDALLARLATREPQLRLAA